MASQLHQIRQVAHLHGGCTPYLDGCQPRQAASSESLLTAMPALGASVETARDGPDALRTYRRELWWRFCEPVLVAWDGVPPSVELQLPLDVHDKTEVACQLTLETWGSTMVDDAIHPLSGRARSGHRRRAPVVLPPGMVRDRRTILDESHYRDAAHSPHRRESPTLATSD